MASACICAAARGINAPSAIHSLRDVCRLTQSDPLEVEITVRHIETVLAKVTPIVEQQKQSYPIKSQQQHYTVQPDKLASGFDNGILLECEPTPPKTPTDVQDVYF